MIVCWRTVDVPQDARAGFLAWIDENSFSLFEVDAPSGCFHVKK